MILYTFTFRLKEKNKSEGATLWSNGKTETKPSKSFCDRIQETKYHKTKSTTEFKTIPPLSKLIHPDRTTFHQSQKLSNQLISQNTKSLSNLCPTITNTFLQPLYYLAKALNTFTCWSNGGNFYYAAPFFLGFYAWKFVVKGTVWFEKYKEWEVCIIFGKEINIPWFMGYLT